MRRLAFLVALLAGGCLLPELNKVEGITDPGGNAGTPAAGTGGSAEGGAGSGGGGANASGGGGAGNAGGLAIPSGGSSTGGAGNGGSGATETGGTGSCIDSIDAQPGAMAVGEDGVAVRWDGSSWSVTESTTATLRGVWGINPDALWAAGDAGIVMFWDGGHWTERQGPAAGRNIVRLVGADSPTVLAEDGVLSHYNGTTWVDVPLPLVGVPVRDVAVTPSFGHWVTLLSDFVFWSVDESGGFSQVVNLENATTMGVIAARNDRDVWFHADSRLYHWDGTVLADHDPGAAIEPSALAVSDLGAYWVGGSSVGHWNGAQWQRTLTGVSSDLRAIAVPYSGGDGSWIVGDDGVIFHVAGSNLCRVPSNTTKALYAVWAP